jgi:hypothetical protein
MGCSVAAASAPQNPLPSPLYSFDLPSPAVVAGHVEADDVLTLNLPYPVPLINGAMLGLGAPGDELDGLSASNAAVSTSATFTLRFSVDRDTTGVAPPDPALVNIDRPYNVLDQAMRGHQAGDEFMSTRLYTRSSSDSANGNNSQVRNNYDEGGTDFAARPETSSNSMAVGQPQDNVDALANAEASAGTYFSVGAGSPSLASLPGSGSPSGAHVLFFNLLQTSLFASHSALGLLQSDDIDALVVFDTNADGVFNGADQVLFSLAPGSPSLATITGASAIGAAADVFSVSSGQAPRLFASASSLGLGAEFDNIDGLEILLCGNAMSCITAHAIRELAGDFDHDGDIDPADYEDFSDCFSGENVPFASGCEAGDFDEDSDIDCADWAAFAQAWTSGGAPPRPEACAAIPASSTWGLVVLSLLLVLAGSQVVITRARRTA